MKVRLRQLGLAAYLKINDCELIGFEEGQFVFESDIDLAEWRIRYSNSCCSRHDSEVCELRKFLSKGKLIS